jgi:ribosomal protein S14
MKDEDPNKHAKSATRKRNRDSNPIDFWDRVLVSPTEIIRHLCIGRRKLRQLADEGRIAVVVIDKRNYYTTESLRRLIDASRNIRLLEPPQMARAKRQPREQEN